MTPKYRQAMLSHVTDEMNRIYRLYRAKNPGFSGRVSLYGHSLGSLLAFDILAHQKAASVGGGTASKSSSSRRNSASQKSRFVAGGIDLGDMLKGAPVTGEKKVVGGSLGDANIEYKSLYFEVDKFFGKKITIEKVETVKVGRWY